MKHANKVKKPYVYTPASATDIRKTIAKERRRLAALEELRKASGPKLIVVAK